MIVYGYLTVPICVIPLKESFHSSIYGDQEID
jgi:hypothetical protein